MEKQRKFKVGDLVSVDPPDEGVCGIILGVLGGSNDIPFAFGFGSNGQCDDDCSKIVRYIVAGLHPLFVQGFYLEHELVHYNGPLPYNIDER